MKHYKYNRVEIRLQDDIFDFIKTVAKTRGISPSALIRMIVGEYKEDKTLGR